MVAIPCQSSKTNRICAKKVHQKAPGQKASLSYKDRLTRLGLDSQELRRLRYDLLPTYKIVFGLTDVLASDMFTLTSSLHYNNTGGHAYIFDPHNSRIDKRKFFFSERVIAPWYALPATSEDLSSLYSFKNLINSTDFSMYVSLGF